jgi:hypothetical protein
MAGKIISGAAAGAGLGATLGTALPGIGNAVGTVVGAVGGAVVGVVTGIFSSKKHYHLYFFDPAVGEWKFVVDGHPSQVNPLAKQYAKEGYVTATIRNKDDKNPDGSLAPTEPPAGFSKSKGATSVNIINIVLIVAILGIAVYFLVIKRKRKK